MPRTIVEYQPAIDASDELGINFDMHDGTFTNFTWDQIREACTGGMNPSGVWLQNMGIDLVLSGIDPDNHAAVIMHLINPSTVYKRFIGNIDAKIAEAPAATPTGVTR